MLSSPSYGELNNKPSADSPYTEVGKWHVAIGFGVGQKTNPLFGGDDIPLYLVPSIYYYGEHFYFDDGTFGYSFVQHEALVISAISALNTHGANFYRWHPNNIFVANQYFDMALANEELSESGPNRLIDISRLSKRKWSLDAGLQFNYYLDDSVMIQGRALYDISNIHQGKSAQLMLEKAFKQERLSIKLNAGIDWLDSNLVNYYYGISAKDDLSSNNHYHTGAVTNPFIGINTSYALTPQWHAALTYRHQKFGHGIANSPIVAESVSRTYFIGFYYVF